MKIREMIQACPAVHYAGRKKRIQRCRHIAAVCMSLILAAGFLGGCTGKEKEGGDAGGSVKGRYVEETVELPISEDEEVLNLTRSKDGNPVLFSHIAGTDISRYEYQDGKWDKTSVDWLNNLYKGTEIYPEEIQEASDGSQIFKGSELNGTEMKPHLAAGSDGKAGEELKAPFLEEKDDLGYPMITNIQKDEKGNYWLLDFYKSKVLVLSPDNLEVQEEINSVQCFSSTQKVIVTDGKGNMAVNTEEGVFTVYDPDMKEKGKVKTDAEGLVNLCGDGDNWYLFSEAGITRYTLNNDLSEVLMDGGMGTMGSAIDVLSGAVKGQGDDFYVLYRQEKTGSVSLMHYIYDKNISAAPEHTLRIFGLMDNQTVQNAVVGFQKAHTDVKVEFQTPGNEGNVSADDIRTLNTELLGGNGADLLLLDGLPADSYIEKGILTNLTDLAGEIMKQNDCIETVLKNTVEKDGKLYGIPVKFSVPIIFGDAERIGALESLDSLSDYLKKNPEEPVFGMADQSYIRDFLFQIFQKELLTEDGKVNQERLAALLEIEKKLMVNARAEAFEEMNEKETRMGTAVSILQKGVFYNGGNAAIVNHPKSAVTDQIRSLPGMMIPYALMRQLSLKPETIRDYYVPHGIVGINQSTKEKELAEEFVKYLFSQEAQGARLDDGLSVFTSVLDGLKEEADSEYAKNYTGMTGWKIDGEEDIEFEMTYPDRQEVEDLIEKTSTLKNPVIQDYVIWNIYQTEADSCLKGDLDPETAAKNVAQKIDTYRAE